MGQHADFAVLDQLLQVGAVVLRAVGGASVQRGADDLEGKFERPHRYKASRIP